MIQITPQMRVLVAIEPVEGRKGIDALVRLCQDKLAEDPFSGCVFIFRSRRARQFHQDRSAPVMKSLQIMARHFPKPL